MTGWWKDIHVAIFGVLLSTSMEGLGKTRMNLWRADLKSGPQNTTFYYTVARNACRCDDISPHTLFHSCIISGFCRSQWPRGLRHGSAASRVLGLRVRIPPGTWMSVLWECCVLSGRGLCDGLVTRPEEFYRLWCA